MTDTTIHHVNVAYDETDSRVREFVTYLKNEKRAKEMAGYYGSSKEASPREKYILAFGHEFSFSCDDRHICTLKLRGT
jgi:hypothetical protein